MYYSTTCMKKVVINILFVLCICVGGTAITRAQTTLPPPDCATQLEIANQRLLKALDAFDKSTRALNAATDEIAKRVTLEALNVQLLAIKDQIIAQQDELIKRLTKRTVKSNFRKVLEVLEKAALVIAGIAIGRGLPL